MNLKILLFAGSVSTIGHAAPPSLSEVRDGYANSDLAFVDRHGALLQELRQDRKARRLEWTTLAELSPALRRAVISAEDRRFEQHHGVDWLALGAAAWENLAGSGRRGGSTITMQLAGLLEVELRSRARGRSFSAKWDQIRYARELETAWTKNEILEAYLNLVSWRGELQGISAAAKGLFGKEPHGLDAAESLVLAALLRAPNAPPETVGRRACVLARAVGGVTPACEELTALTADRLGHRYDLGYRENLAPHAARRALAWKPQAFGTRRLTLDRDLQKFANETLRSQLTSLAKRGVRDGAVLVVDNASGEVLAYVANGGGEASSAVHVDGIQARRQAGSALKPFLYGLAFEKRVLRPSTLLDDSPVDIPVGGGVYHPSNYDHSFHGPVSVAVSLGSSLNVPAVRALLLVGVDPFHRLLGRLGFGDLREPEYYGPSLALGAVDVSLWDLVTAYRTLARGGLKSDLKLNADEGVPFDVRVFSASSARAVTEILAAPENRAVSFGFDSPLATRAGAAVKTGTSKDMRDNWCVGYTKRYTVGVWIGNFDGEPMRDVSGVTGAGPVWAAVMDFLQPADSAPRKATPAPSVPMIAVAQGVQPSRIVYPVPGTIIALDPDMPPDAQRILFEASSFVEGAGAPRWTLDGDALESTRAQVVWEPRRGRHRLALVDATSRTLDAVEFTVR